jgi:hypothetical protein
MCLGRTVARATRFPHDFPVNRDLGRPRRYGFGVRDRSLSAVPIGVAIVVAIVGTIACGGGSDAPASTDAADTAPGSDVADDGANESSPPFDAFRDAARDDVRPDDASAASACADLSAALCDRIAACAPFLVGRAFLDAADCHARATLACMQRMSLVDSYPPLDVAADCTAQLKTVTCDAFFARGVHGFDGLIDYPCPVIGGLRDIDRHCVADAQCASGYCAYRWTGCGFCKPSPLDGAAPADGYECGPWLLLGDDKRCHLPGLTGDACNPDAPCASDLTCTAGHCAIGAAEGAACSDTAPCDWTQGLSCDATTARCTKITLAKQGEICDESAGWFTLRGEYCVGGTSCVMGGTSKTCVKRIDDGAACIETSGALCRGPSDCIAGVCAVADDTTCN